MTLAWWRARLGDDADTTSLVDWEESVKDVNWVLGCLKDEYKMGNTTAISEVPNSTTWGHKHK